AYLYVKKLIKGQFIVLALAGNYNPPFPDIRAYDVQATRDEVLDNWIWILERKRVYEEFKELDEPPTPFKYYNGDYECRDCAWRAGCDAMKVRLDIMARNGP
ncbi:hypothetical protein LCGC14_3015920, partial [marine sediment metagenome]